MNQLVQQGAYARQGSVVILGNFRRADVANTATRGSTSAVINLDARRGAPLALPAAPLTKPGAADDLITGWIADCRGYLLRIETGMKVRAIAGVAK